MHSNVSAARCSTPLGPCHSAVHCKIGSVPEKSVWRLIASTQLPAAEDRPVGFYSCHATLFQEASFFALRPFAALRTFRAAACCQELCTRRIFTVGVPAAAASR